MDILEVIKELRQELERIDGLILALDSMQTGRRRGRPPKLLQQLRASSPSRTRKTRAAKKRRKKTAKSATKKASK